MSLLSSTQSPPAAVDTLASRPFDTLSCPSPTWDYSGVQRLASCDGFMHSRLPDTLRTPSPTVIAPMPQVITQPFHQPLGPQFSDIRGPITAVPNLPSVQPNPAFSIFHDFRPAQPSNTSTAPCYINAYGNPFNQCAPATASQAQQPPRQGLFKRMSLNNHQPQLLSRTHNQISLTPSTSFVSMGKDQSVSWR